MSGFVSMYRTDLIRPHAYATGEGRMLRSLSRSGGPGLCPAAYAAGYTEIAHPALHALDYFTGLFHVDKDIDGPRVWEGRRPRRPKRQHRISTTDGRRPTLPEQTKELNKVKIKGHHAVFWLFLTLKKKGDRKEANFYETTYLFTF